MRSPCLHHQRPVDATRAGYPDRACLVLAKHVQTDGDRVTCVGVVIDLERVRPLRGVDGGGKYIVVVAARDIAIREVREGEHAQQRKSAGIDAAGGHDIAWEGGVGLRVAYDY